MVCDIFGVTLQAEDNYNGSYSQTKSYIVNFLFFTFYYMKMCKPEKLVSICKLIGIILATIILTITFLIHFVVGFVYRNQCPVQHRMCQYNIVVSSAGVFMIVIWILAAIFYQIYSKRLGFVFSLLILLFEIIWIIISIIKISPLWTRDVHGGATATAPLPHRHRQGGSGAAAVGFFK